MFFRVIDAIQPPLTDAEIRFRLARKNNESREREIRKRKEDKKPKIKEILFLQRLLDEGQNVTMDAEDQE